MVRGLASKNRFLIERLLIQLIEKRPVHRRALLRASGRTGVPRALKPRADIMIVSLAESFVDPWEE